MADTSTEHIKIICRDLLLKDIAPAHTADILCLSVERDALSTALSVADALIRDLWGHEGAEGFSESTHELTKKYDEATAFRRKEPQT